MERKIFVFFLIVTICINLSAKTEGNLLESEPYLSWSDGSRDFFVMYNSNITNEIKLFGESDENPQADTCVESSKFTLTDFHIPPDAVIEEAYLVWMGAVDPDKMDEPTDNIVNFKYVKSGEETVSHEQEINATGDPTGKLLTDAQSFNFESIKFTDSVEIGCTTEESGVVEDDVPLGYFTYRVDITDFFREISQKNISAGESKSGVYYGDYIFSGLECTDHDIYKCKTMMMSAWAVFFVYRSQNIRPKKIYFYKGFSLMQGDEVTVPVKSFELPKDPVVRLTSIIAEGDPGLVEPSLPMENIFIQGPDVDSKFRLYNECNPLEGDNVEVFNSVSSIITWDAEVESEQSIKCLSGINDADMNYGIEVDTFLLDSKDNDGLKEHLKKGNTSLDVIFSVNKDAVFTNFFVLSVDQKVNNFDIPPEASDPEKSQFNFPHDREKHYCACPASYQPHNDYYCYDEDKEFYYFIKVQNWGENEEKRVVVTDKLDDYLEYIPNTTEIATVYDSEKDVFTDWKLIPDEADGSFPLINGHLVAESMTPCDKITWICEDTFLIRYKVKPKYLMMHYVFENIAYIGDIYEDEPYGTNSFYPLKLVPESFCNSECVNPTPEMCGGVRIEENDDDSDFVDSDVADIDENDAEKDDDSVVDDQDVIVIKSSSDGCGCSMLQQ